MALATDALPGASLGERSTEHINQRNGFRDQDRENRAETVGPGIPKLCEVSYFLLQ